MTTAPNVPDGVGSTDDEFDTLIEDAKRPWRPVRLFVAGDLRHEYEEIKGRIDERAAQRDAAATAAAAAAAGMTADVRMSTKGPEAAADPGRDPEQDKLDEITARMRKKVITVVVQALSSKEYNKLLEAHPARKNPTNGHIDPRDFNNYNAGAYNSATFPPALVRACIVKPTMTPERWAKLDDALIDAQFDRLYNACAEVNRRDEDIPFLLDESEGPPN